MGYSHVLKFQEDLIEKYKYKPIPPLYREEALSLYLNNLPEGFSLDGAAVPLYSPGGLKLCNRYNRIVIGDYGAFVEILPEDIIHENIKVKQGQEYRDVDERYAKHTKYSWLTSNDQTNIKIYFQKKPVDYADYVPGRYYISPYECSVLRNLTKETSMVVSRDTIAEWLNGQGVFLNELLDYYEELSPIHGSALKYSIEHNLFPADFEYWVRLNEVCELEGGLSFEQYAAVRYNLDLIDCSSTELNGRLLVLAEDVRTAIQMGLDEFTFPFEAQALKPSELRMLLNMPPDTLLGVMHLSKVFAGCKCEPLIGDVKSVIDAAVERVRPTAEECKEKELAF